MSIFTDDTWTHGTTASRVFRIVVGVYLIVLLSGLWFGRGKR